MSDLLAVVLAAGQGKRMKSRTTKVLHRAAGRPLIYFPVVAAVRAGASRVVVVCSAENEKPIADYLRAELTGTDVHTAVQSVPRGTGDAARVGLEAAGSHAGEVLILCGDTPLVRESDIAPLLSALSADGKLSLAALSCVLDDPTGYGRILRDGSGRFVEIREQRDLSTEAERAVREINAGVYAARGGFLRDALSELRPDNAQGEYYLTDVVPHAVRSGGAVAVAGSRDALVGVNDRAQLVEAERALFRRIAERHLANGVSVRGDACIDDTVEIEPDVEIESGVRLRGATRVGEGTRLDVGSVVTDCRIGQNVVIKPYCVLASSVIEDAADVGPFAHLRPESVIGPGAHVGNFVEMKKTKLGKGAKANHLSYLGDGDVGAGANIGAGTIFCNYDGFAKYRTEIGEGAFIGSDTQLIAPVRIGKGAYVATGATITQDVPDDALAISRTKQQNKEGYASRIKARLAAQAKKRGP